MIPIPTSNEDDDDHHQTITSTQQANFTLPPPPPSAVASSKNRYSNNNHNDTTSLVPANHQFAQLDDERKNDSTSKLQNDPYLYLPQRKFPSVEACVDYVVDWNETRTKHPQDPFIKNPFGNASLPCGPNGPMYPKYTCCTHSIIIPLILGPVIIFCTSTVEHDEWWSKIVVIVLTILDLICLQLGSATDPGVCLPLRVGDEPPADGQLVEIEGVGELKLDVCRTCKILRPPRSSHCAYSQLCILYFDHHCGVTQHRTSLYTFKFFVTFMYITSIMIIFIFIRSIMVAVTWDTKTMTQTSRGTWYLVSTCLSLAFIGLMFCWVCGVGCHYTDLVCTGETLKDRRGRRKQFHHEDAGWSCFRWLKTMCGRSPPSKLTADVKWRDIDGNPRGFDV
jgi:hypothetical protein